MNMVCEACGYVYDPAKGEPASNIPPGTPWDKVPGAFVCPECGAGKEMFAPGK